MIRSEPARAHLLWTALGRHLGTEASGRPAVRGHSVVLTYRRLAGAVARGAEELRAVVPAGRRVVIASRNQLEVGLAFLATLAAGRVAVLADPTSPDRVGEIVERSRGVPFTAEGGGAARDGIPLVRVGEWISTARDVERIELPAVGPRDEAFWVFTSGSTGPPRAVAHVHGAPLACFEAFARRVVRLGPADVTISTAGLPFVYALGNNFLFPLMTGASCVLPSDLLLPTVVAALVRHRATVLVAGPW
ncbi:MAG: AMP-binding protein, partial [Candidatus Binatia bacterium]